MAAPRVLLAEDDHELRSLLAQALRRWGYEVREIATGTGLAQLLFGSREYRDDLPDVLVTDIRMPGASGLSALRAVRVNGWETPVILLTAFPDPEVEVEARDLGASLLAKPFPIEDLRRLVDAATA